MGFQMGRVSVELCLAPLSGQFGQDPCENIQAIPLRLAFLRALCRQYSTDAPRQRNPWRFKNIIPKRENGLSRSICAVALKQISRAKRPLCDKRI